MKALKGMAWALLAFLMTPLQAAEPSAPETAVTDEDRDQWQAAMEATAQLQREAVGLKMQIQKLQQAPGEGGLAEIRKLEQRKQELHLKAARQMERLSAVAPDPEWAAMSVLRAGQNYLRAEAHESATGAFENVAKLTADQDLRAQALYWNGLCHERMKQLDEAARLYRAIPANFPDSKWAKYARGRLADPIFRQEEHECCRECARPLPCEFDESAQFPRITLSKSRPASTTARAPTPHRP